MPITKKLRDQFIKILLGKSSVPRGLVELNQYFRLYGPINFTNEKGEDGSIIAISSDFRYGSIVTSGKTPEELDKNIKDAILTSFGVPSSFAKEAEIHKVGEKSHQYVLV